RKRAARASESRSMTSSNRTGSGAFDATLSLPIVSSLWVGQAPGGVRHAGAASSLSLSLSYDGAGPLTENVWPLTVSGCIPGEVVVAAATISVVGRYW